MAATLPSCTTGVNDTGFTGFTSAQPPQNTGVTTLEETDGPGDTDEVMTMGGSADDTTSGTPPGTTATTDPGSTSNGLECDPPCAAGEVCIDGVCFDDGMGESSGGGGGCNAGPGNYEACLGAGGAVDTSGCGGGTPTCITGGDPPIGGVCSQTPCSDACDCPASPGGTAVVSCDAITGDGTNFCYLDCSAGQTCPGGMVCFGSLACVWPGDGADGVPYGDCFNNGGSICGLDGVCLSDDPMAPTVAVCTEDCNNVGDCPPSPGGTAPVTCQDVTGDAMNECVIDCSLGSCPAGMTCFAGFLCMWN